MKCTCDSFEKLSGDLCLYCYKKLYYQFFGSPRTMMEQIKKPLPVMVAKKLLKKKPRGAAPVGEERQSLKS